MNVLLESLRNLKMDAQEIKNIRKSMDLTQEAFARFLNVSLRSVAGWEAGRCHPRGLYLAKIKEVQNTPKDHLGVIKNG